MTVTQQDAKRRLNSSKNLLNSLGISSPNPAVDHKDIPHPHRTCEVPEFLKVTAGVLAHTNTVKEVSESLDLDPQAVQGYKHGKVGGREDAGLQQQVNSQLGHVRDVAIEKLMGSLGLLTQEKMEKVGAKDLSSIASNMSKVVNNLTPQNNTGPAAQILIYSPQVKEENRFKVVEV